VKALYNIAFRSRINGPLDNCTRGCIFHLLFDKGCSPSLDINGRCLPDDTLLLALRSDRPSFDVFAIRNLGAEVLMATGINILREERGDLFGFFFVLTFSKSV
jgi:hypothetical protein